MLSSFDYVPTPLLGPDDTSEYGRDSYFKSLSSQSRSRGPSWTTLFTARSALDTSPRQGEGEGEGHSQTVRRLTYVDGVAILAGIMLGSGIFASPGLALSRAGSTGLVLVAWALSGVLATLCAQCYLELGGMLPSAGGDFEYLRSAFGERVAFAFAWFYFFVGKTGAQAIIATVFGRYFECVLRREVASLKDSDAEESLTAKMLGVSLIACVTALNCFGVKESAVFSLLMTIVKFSLVLLVLVFAIVYISTDAENREDVNENFSPSSSFHNSKGLFGFGSAMVACLWCFDGYADGNFLQEEMLNPVRDLPRIVHSSLLLVTAGYIAINVAYLCVLSRDTMSDSSAIAVQFGETVSDLFVAGKKVFPAVLATGVSLSTVGAINGSIMTGGRAFYAIARAGSFPSLLASINRRGAPWVALIAQAMWSITLLLLPGSNFSALLDYFGPTSWLFYALTASSVIYLRIKEPDLERPFRVPFYPLPPLIVIVIALFIFGSSVAAQPLFTLLAVGFALLSIPVHWLMQRCSKPRTHSRILDLDFDLAFSDSSSDKQAPLSFG